MRAGRALPLAAVIAVTGAAPVVAQNTEFDAALNYAARDEILLPGDTEKSDNDIFRLTTALSWDAGYDGRMRAALELGVRNEDFNGNFPAVTGGELTFGRRVGNQRYAAGGRLRSAEDMSTTTELAYSAEHFGSLIDWHALVGVQFVGDADAVPGRSGTSVFGQVDANYYVNSNWVITAGVLADTDGEVYAFGTEYRPGDSRLSLFLDYAEAFDEYRGQRNYDSLSVGIRLVPKAKTLRKFRQTNLNRTMFRFVEVQ